MITLLTGLPGHGKTLYALSLLKSEKNYQDRPLYIHGVDNVDHEFFGSQDFDPTKWQDLPDGSLIVIDEVHKFWPPQNGAQKPPPHIEDIAEHRHRGFDFIIITQDPWGIHSFVRNRVEQHLHVRRPFGYGFTNVREFQAFEKRPHEPSAKDRTVSIRRWKYDKKLFDKYHSATQHTVKKRVPLKLVGALLAVVFGLSAIVYLLTWGYGFLSDGSAAPEQTTEVTAYERVENPQFDEVSVVSLDSPEFAAAVEAYTAKYYLQRSEVIAGLGHTQPFYEEVMQPVTFPKPRCILMQESNKCVCHSQQGTVMQVEFPTCSFIAQNGWFDPSKPDDEVMQGGYNQFSSRVLGVSVEPEQESQMEVQTSPGPSKPPFTNWNHQPRPLRR
jgi:zona occludens toxin